ncbi:hypothetical protein Fmac_020856 [Flemingia macrophylla]|uniref:Ycf15 n=1 Tax=Flemingia macrophylla TaxID=520843 RepID=A0ABD1LV98_9FABA
MRLVIGGDRKPLLDPDHDRVPQFLVSELTVLTRENFLSSSCIMSSCNLASRTTS